MIDIEVSVSQKGSISKKELFHSILNNQRILIENHEIFLLPFES